MCRAAPGAGPGATKKSRSSRWRPLAAAPRPAPADRAADRRCPAAVQARVGSAPDAARPGEAAAASAPRRREGPARHTRRSRPAHGSRCARSGCFRYPGRCPCDGRGRARCRHMPAPRAAAGDTRAFRLRSWLLHSSSGPMPAHGGSLYSYKLAALESGERVAHADAVACLVDGDVRGAEDLVRVGTDIAGDDRLGALRSHGAACLDAGAAARVHVGGVLVYPPLAGLRIGDDEPASAAEPWGDQGVDIVALRTDGYLHDLSSSRISRVAGVAT